LGWIVQSKEDIQHGLGWDLLFIEYHPCYLGVTGGLRANGFIVRVSGVASGIANLNVLDTSKLHKA
jgi:hypothetical protein